MMATIAIKIDTQTFAKKLKAAGLKASQAEAVVEVLRESTDATEKALEELAKSSELEAAKIELSAKITELKYDILKWMIPLMLGLYGLVIFKMT